MSASFAELRRYKQLGLSYSAVLVLSYLQEQGPTPVGSMADYIGCSTRCVEMALAAIKRLGLMPGNSPKNFSHDHDQHIHEYKGTPNGFAGSPAETIGTVTPPVDADPLCKRLSAFDVLPWCADMIIQKIGRGELKREDVDRQLDHHQVRLDSAFKFKAHPARFLFSAILKNYAPPADNVSRQAPHSGANVSSMAPQRSHIARPFGAATLERRAEFEAQERERQDAECRRLSLLAMFANQCRRERGLMRKTPEQQLPQLVKHGLTLDDLLDAIARCEAEASMAVASGRAV